MDELKKYLRQHEEDMQVETPGVQRMWERLEAHRQKKNKSKHFVMFTRHYVAAACVLVLIGLGIWQWMREDKNLLVPTELVQNDLPVIKHGDPKKDTIADSERLVEARQEEDKKNKEVKIQSKPEQPMADGYAQLVRHQLQQLRNTPVYAESPAYFTEFKEQLQQMDADEALLKQDMQIYGLNDKMVEALSTIYQNKLNLLKSLGSEINKMNKATIKKQEQDKLQPYFLNL